MTRKDYEIIASRIYRNVMNAQNLGISEYRKAALRTLFEVSSGLCDDLVKDNPRFDRDRFLRACGFDYEAVINL